MKIYTKTGDQGDTQVYSQQVERARKDDARLCCYGTLDELNSHIGLFISSLHALKQQSNDLIVEVVKQAEIIQRDIFQIGFALSDSNRLQHQQVDFLEHCIDSFQDSLPQQTQFILPGGCLPSAQAHVCRTVCRRAERELVSLQRVHSVDDIAMSYLNRLSDYWFVVARLINHQLQYPDIAV